MQIRTVLLSIQALLSAPNPDDPLANDVAELWKVNEVAKLFVMPENGPELMLWETYETWFCGRKMSKIVNPLPRKCL